MTRTLFAASLLFLGCHAPDVPTEEVDVGTDTAAEPVPDCADFEVCDGRDNDCDGEIDEEALDAIVLCLDDTNVGIRDGRGNPRTAIVVCEAPPPSEGSWIPDCTGTDMP